MNQYTNPWTKEEIQIIEKNYSSNKDAINLKLDRTHQAILNKASKLNIRKRQNDSDVKKRMDNIKITPDIAYIVGALIGDGCFLEKINQIQLSVTSEGFITEYKQRLFNVTGIDYKIGKKIVAKKLKNKQYLTKFYDVRCGRKRWYDYFKSLAKNKEALLQYNDEILKAFIKGYVDAEGCANYRANAISIGNTNKSHIDLLEKMFDKLGFHYRKAIGKTIKGKPYYYISISTIFFVRKYAAEIGFSEPKKQKKALSMNYKIKRWTDEEITKLREEYPKIGSQVEINRSRDCISHKASELNIRYRGWKN